MPAHDLPTDNASRPAPTVVKGPAPCLSDSDPMTAAQASRLKALAEEARELEAFDPKLTAAEAARRIDALQAKLRLQDGPPHTL
jgi:hypothetical protein